MIVCMQRIHLCLPSAAMVCGFSSTLPAVMHPTQEQGRVSRHSNSSVSLHQN